MSAHRHFSEEGRRAAREPEGSADSSWVRALSLVPKSAWHLLLSYLPARTASALDVNSDSGGPVMGKSPLTVAYFHCQHGNATRASSDSAGTLAWLTHDSLTELGIQKPAAECSVGHRIESGGHVLTARHFLSQGLLKERARADGEQVKRDCACAWRPDSASAWSADRTWWRRLWGSADTSTIRMIRVTPNSNKADTSRQPALVEQNILYFTEKGTRAISMTSDQSGNTNAKSTMPNESARPAKQLTHKQKLQTPGFYPELQKQSLPQAPAEVNLLTPDQDNGYSSLEEEQSNNKLRMSQPITGEEASEAESLVPAAQEKTQSGSEEERGNAGAQTRQDECAEAVKMTPPHQCQNKVIAYIMGSPCSEESESEEDSDWDSNDDDGFDSEGSAHLSQSEELDDSESEEDSESEDEDSETERLLNSLCQNKDPYNPLNFSAPIRTTSKSSSPPVPSLSESASLSSQPPSSSPSSESESSEEACEVDEEENLELWNSFSCSADPYSLFNFQASIQTQTLQKKTASADPVYKRAEAEERLDSGFSEISCSSSSSCTLSLKKVTFVEEVEEFYASSDEDRRGPWEEMARDRCRFQRRIQDVEKTISYCLSSHFRLDIFQKRYNTS